MNGLTLDTGALVALERGRRRAAALVRTVRGRGLPITVPAPVVTEWWRGQRGPIARALDAFEVEPLGVALARVAGEALARVDAGAIDAIVMASAAMRGDHVLTGDIEDLERLRAVFPNVRVLRV
ncbi:MAG: PIN domain-containing protein [Sandaracinaceae bacterium]|nr:PIN domain-containing protein [Sandaracinaceae bacterium]